VAFSPSRFRPLPWAAIACWGAIVLLGSFASPVGAADAPPAQNRLLNPVDKPSFPGIGAWMVDDLNTRVAQDAKPQIGTAAIDVAGKSKAAGGKVDIPVYEGELAGCQRLSLWVSPTAIGNVSEVGFQVQDAKGQWLMQTVPVDWTDWKRVDIDPTAGGMRLAYEQKGQDGKMVLPLRSVHVVWFAKDAGPAALRINGLTASVAPGPDTAVSIRPPENLALEANHPLALNIIAENHSAAEQPISIHYTLQANSAFADPPMPDPVLGYDRALGCPSKVSVDGVDKGDAKLCDGDDYSSFETPWGDNYKEVVATIDLGKTRQVSAVHYLPGDANWIFKADLSTSLDGTKFDPVPGAQGVDLHSQWGGPHPFPWAKPTPARYLRFRFHNDGQATNCFRLPPTISVYDGIANDVLSVPQVGPIVSSGSVKAALPARDFAELAVRGTENIGPGAYLLGLETTVSGRKEVRWSHVLVAPTDTVDPDRARRFGFNGSDTSPWMAENMRRCGFGWVRFENAKWMMYMPSRDHVAFDGSVAPWNLKYDDIFSNYQNAHLHVLPYVFQPPEWATSAPANVTQNRAGYPPKDTADYSDAIFQLVARYGRTKVDAALLKSNDKKSGLGMIDAVELWNEPNLNAPSWGPFVGTLPQYFDVLRAGAEGSRRADPKLPVSSCGWGSIDLEVVGQLSEHHYADGKTPLDFVDIVNVHFYSGRSEPETAGWDPNASRNGPATTSTTYPDQVEELVAWRDKLKPAAEIWLTEIGNDVGGPIGLTERHQAAKLPRGIMLALASGIDRVFVYREAGSIPSMHAGAGLLRNDMSTRPSWLTVATMIRQLQGFKGHALRLPTADPNVWLFLWQDGQRRVVTAWTLGQTTPLGIDLGKARVCDAFGYTTSIANTSAITLSYFPTYITLTESTPALTALTAKAHAQTQEHVATQRKLANMPMRLIQFGSGEHVAMFKGYGPPRRFTPVNKDTPWNEKEGYGWVTSAVQNEDASWIADALERSGCRVSPDQTFRLRLDPGRQTLRIRANALNDQQPVNVVLKTGTTSQKAIMSKDAPVAEFTVTGGKDPIEISLDNWGVFRWLTAIPQSEVKGNP